ncbi:hypothetical protein GA0115246_100641, partial [Streptomyces sp. SolWspMP-sol7th]
RVRHLGERSPGVHPARRREHEGPGGGAVAGAGKPPPGAAPSSPAAVKETFTSSAPGTPSPVRRNAAEAADSVSQAPPGAPARGNSLPSAS